MYRQGLTQTGTCAEHSAVHPAVHPIVHNGVVEIPSVDTEKMHLHIPAMASNHTTPDAPSSSARKSLTLSGQMSPLSESSSPEHDFYPSVGDASPLLSSIPPNFNNPARNSIEMRRRSVDMVFMKNGADKTLASADEADSEGEEEEV